MYFCTLYTNQLDQISTFKNTTSSSLFEFQNYHSTQTRIWIMIREE